MGSYVYKKHYDYVASFGCMCSCAIFLRQNGFRSKSTFFDWLDSGIKENINILQKDFVLLLDKNYLSQKYPNELNCVYNSLYNITFVHLFDIYKTFDEQYEKVIAKVEKSIANFKTMLTKSLLLVYYCRKKEEQGWIVENQEFLRSFCMNYKVDIIFVFNYNNIPQDFIFAYFVIPFNNTHLPFGGGVSYPFTNCQALMEWIKDKYNEDDLKLNLLFEIKTKKRSKVSRWKNIINKFRKKRLILENA